MWVFPLRLSACSPDSRGLESDFERLFQACESSLTRRGKPTRSASWRREWQTGCLMPLRSARIFESSTAGDLLDEWISSLGASHVRTSASQDEAREFETGTVPVSGLSSLVSSVTYDPASSSWRTSGLLFAEGSTSFSPTLPRWGLMQRGEVFPLPLAERRIGESACSSSPSTGTAWKTPCTADSSQKNAKYAQDGKVLSMQAAQWRTPSASDGEGGVMEMREDANGKYKLRDHSVAAMKYWPTPAVADTEGGRKTRSGKRSDELLLNGMAAQWPTPNTRDHHSQGATHNPKAKSSSLATKVEKGQWPTPPSRDHKNGQTSEKTRQRNSRPLSEVVISSRPDRQSPTPGSASPNTCSRQLNARFVEWLMGLPEGWVSLSPRASTSYAAWETALCQSLRHLLSPRWQTFLASESEEVA